MAQPALRGATYEDLLQAPAQLVAELLNGRLHTHPRPTPRHALAASGLGGELYGPFHKGNGGPGGWWILDEPELHLDSDVMVPDLTGWRRERMSELPDAAWIEMAPDWVCEVLSPSTAETDRGVKMPLYEHYHVSYLWLVDPAARTLEAYALRGGKWSLLATVRDTESVRLPPFAAAEFALSALWS